MSQLRSKFTLLLLVGAALLAIGGTAMALMTDLGGNILPEPTVQGDKADIADPSANPHGDTSPAIQGQGADTADSDANTLPAQKIQSEEAVHARGKTVTVTGSNWQPGESVHISVNDDQGKTWSRTVDATADAGGRVQVHFQVPEWFGATYKVTAMGDQSGVATTSFTDGNVSLRGTSPAPASWTVNYTTHGGRSATDNTSCATGGTDGSKTISPGTTGTASVGISNKGSVRFGTVSVPADSTLVFDHWTDQNGNTVADDACLSGDPSGTNGNITDLIAHFDSAKQAPEAESQPIVSTDEDTAKTITMSGTDEGGDDLTFFIVSGPSHGTLGPIGALTCAGTAPRTCSANVTYTPEADYNGFDVFSFKASDGASDSNPAAVSMLVGPVNDTPVATDETRTMSEDGGPLSVDFGALVSDGETADGDLAYDISDPDPAKGSLGGEGPTRTFTPAADFNGTVNIDYTPADRGDPDKCKADDPSCAVARVSVQKTVSVTVDAVNDAPSFTKGPDQTIDEDSGAQSVSNWATDISAGPADEDGQRLTFEVTSDNDLFTSGGQPAIDASGKLTYEAAPDANGSATVTVKLQDDGDTAKGEVNQSAEQTFTIKVGAVNDAPVARADTTTTDEDTKLVFPTSDLVGNDDEGANNESSQTLTITEVYDSAHGAVSLGNDGNIAFTPEADFSGDATFRYLMCDNGIPSKCSVQRTAVDVTTVNDAPVADDKSVTTDEDTARDVTLSATDVEGDALGYTILSAPRHGILSGTGTNLTYTPADEYRGPDSFTFEASDGTAESDPATVSIAVDTVNDAPVASEDTKWSSEDTPLVFAARQLLGNDDPGPANESGQTLTVTAVDRAVNGQVSFDAKGDINFTPDADFNGQASFEYTVCDNGSPSECSETIVIVNVTMSPVNDAPIVSNLQGDSDANEGDVKAYTFDIADVDSSTFSASVDCGGAGKGKLVAGSLRMTATNGKFKCKYLDGLISATPVDISVQVSDGEMLSNVEFKSVSVSNVAPAPTGVSSSSQNVLTGPLNPVTFTGTATDVSQIDLAAGFGWQWGIDGGAYSPFGVVNANTFTIGGANNPLYFSTCGAHTVEARAGDKDGGVSAESPQATQSVNVYDGAFGPPLVDGTTNVVQNGQIAPVEISVGCGTTNLTGLSPHIQLLGGNVSPEIETGSTTVTPTSVLAADTTQTMRQVDGGYIYNLQVPSNATANQEFTILVNPFGSTADHAATGMYVVIKIRE